MRFLAFILAVIVLLMGISPCKDEPARMKSEQWETATATTAHDDHKDSGDHCSPLCSCACCSVHYCPDAFPTMEEKTPAILLKTHSTFYAGKLISVSLPVWQPPQLVL